MNRPATLCVLLIVFLLPPATAPAQDDHPSLRAELEATRERLRVLREKILRLEEEIARLGRLSAASVPADRFRELLEWLRAGDARQREAAIRQIAAAPNLREVVNDPAVRAVAEVRVLLRDDFEGGRGKWSEKLGGVGKKSVRFESGRVRFHRTGGSGSGGEASISRTLKDEVHDCSHLILGGRIRVKSHSLPNSGWHSQAHGGPGEYPVHVQIEWLDEEESRRRWSHGFLSRHDGSTRLVNFTKVAPSEWTSFAFDLLAAETRASRDPERPGLAVPAPMLLTTLRLMGNGWDFAGEVDEVQLVSVRFP